MIDLKKILEEVYDSGPKNYPAYSQSPRKDFVPVSTKGGYDYPYQQNQATGFPPTLPQPQTLPVFHGRYKQLIMI